MLSAKSDDCDVRAKLSGKVCGLKITATLIEKHARRGTRADIERPKEEFAAPNTRFNPAPFQGIICAR